MLVAARVSVRLSTADIVKIGLKGVYFFTRCDGCRWWNQVDRGGWRVAKCPRWMLLSEKSWRSRWDCVLWCWCREKVKKGREWRKLWGKFRVVSALRGSFFAGIVVFKQASASQIATNRFGTWQLRCDRPALASRRYTPSQYICAAPTMTICHPGFGVTLRVWLDNINNKHCMHESFLILCNPYLHILCSLRNTKFRWKKWSRM